MQKIADWRVFLIQEARRKAIHLTGLSVPLSLIWLGRNATAAFVAIAMAVAVVLERQRLSGRIRLPEVRKSEAGRVAGYVYFILGSLLTVILFKPAVAVVSMLMLCLGDAGSGLVGSIIKGSNIREEALAAPEQRRWIKPIPVVLFMFVACAAIGYLTSGYSGLPPQVYLAGAAGATVADSVTTYFRGKVVDDNFTIPLYSGIAMTAASLALIA